MAVDHFAVMTSLREEFLIAIRPLSISLQLLSSALLVVACALASPDYQYDKMMLAAFAAMLSISIPLCMKLKLLVPLSIFNSWTIAACFLLLISPSPSRDFWAFCIAGVFLLVTAPLYEKTRTYLFASIGTGIILGGGNVPLSPVPGDTSWVVLTSISVLFLGCVMNSFFSRLHFRNIQLRHDLEGLAYLDPLTGIPNRRKLILDVTNASTSIDMTQCCFMMIDIDGFKQINDRLGHDQGDLVLEQFGNMLSRLLYSDRFGRMGGEEFGVLTLYGGEVRARYVAQLILDQAHEIQVDGHPLTVSIGIASADATFTDMARNADDALYQAKRSGKDRFVVYRQAGNSDVVEPAEAVV